MRTINFIVLKTALNLIACMQFLFFFRAIASWFPQVQGGKIGEILYMLTEPFISPVRRLIDRIGVFRGMPIDISFLVAYLILVFLDMLLRGLLF